MTKTLSEWADTAIRFLLVSSKDPQKWSASLKFTLLGLVPMIIHTASIACGFGLVCLGLDADGLNALAEALGSIAYYTLSAIASVGFVWAFGRKLIRTAQGKNLAI